MSFNFVSSITFHTLCQKVERRSRVLGVLQMKTSKLNSAGPTVMCKVRPQGRKPNSAYRKREYLNQDELERLFGALKANRHGHRDYMIALVMFLHGLRVSELIDMHW